MHARIGVRNDYVSSMTYDRRFCHTVVFALKDVPFFKSAVLVSGVPFRKSTLNILEHVLPCKSSGPCPKLSARLPKVWSAMHAQNECRVSAAKNVVLVCLRVFSFKKSTV